MPFMIVLFSFIFQVGCGDAEFGEIFHKNNIRCRSRDGDVQFRYFISALLKTYVYYAN